MRFLLSCLFIVGLLGSPPLLWPQSVDDSRLTDEEKEILELTNAGRKESQLLPLRVNATLMKCARLHSANMAKQKKMAHELDGKSPFDRLRDIGYKYRRAGENVAYGDGPVTVKEIFDGWMNSEGHRKNILNKGFVEIGLGAAASGDAKYYTQLFGQPATEAD